MIYFSFIFYSSRSNPSEAPERLPPTNIEDDSDDVTSDSSTHRFKDEDQEENENHPIENQPASVKEEEEEDGDHPDYDLKDSLQETIDR